MAENGSDSDIIAELAVKLHLVADKSEFEKGDELLKHLKEGLEFFAGFEAVKGLFELVEHTTEAAVSAKHLAERLGTSIESVQELGYAADVTGASAEDMRVSLQHLAFAAETATKTGTGPLINGLQKLHIPLSNLKKEKLDANLEEIAEGFKNAGPEVNKTALAIEIFGRKGTTLIPLLNKGKEGIQELRREFVSLGAETTAEDAEKLEKFEETQKKVKYMWEGIKFDAVKTLLPVLQELLEKFMAWFKVNRELISSSLVSLIHALTTAIQILSVPLGLMIRAFDWISKDGDAVSAILITIGAAIGYVASAAAIAWLETNLALAGIPALIALIVYAIVKIVKNWDKVKEAVLNVARTIKEKFKEAFDYIADLPVIKQLIELVNGIEDLIDHADRNKPITNDAFKSTLNPFGVGSMTGGEKSSTGSSHFFDDVTPTIPKKDIESNGPQALNQEINIENHIHASPDMDEKDIADLVGEQTEKKLADWVRTNYKGAGLGVG